MKEDQFLRDFISRQYPDLIFFTGAGASKSSGIPTAHELIWYFKRDIYCSRNNIPLEALKDITHPAVQQTIKSWIDINFPIVDSNEYAFFFEQAYPNSQARKRVMTNYVSKSTLGLGYQCLGALIRTNKVRNLLTTNFDNLIEKVYPDAYIVSDESFHRASDLEIAGSRVQLIKLHGDYRYDKLKNTEMEIQTINSQIQARLKDFFKEFGILIIGYSGRDESVMSLFEDLVENSDAFSKGFYWCMKGEEVLNKRVAKLISKLKSKGVESDTVEIENFDELMIHLYRQSGIKDQSIETLIKNKYDVKIPFAYTFGNMGKQPPIKTNSIRIKDYPTSVFKFATDIDSWEVLTKLVEGKNIVTSLSKGPSVIAVGNRQSIEETFNGHIKDKIEIFNILSEHVNKLNRNSGFVYKIFYDIFAHHFEIGLKLSRIGKRTFYNPSKNELFESKWSRQKYHYYPAFSFGLDYRENNLFMIIQPSVVPIQQDGTILSIEKKKTIINEILSSKYNAEVNDMLDYWLSIFKNGTGNIQAIYPAAPNVPVASFIMESSYSFSGKK